MTLQPTFLKFGIFYGITSIIMQLFSFYIMEIGIGMQMILGVIMMVIFFVLAANEEKNANGGFLSYGEALKTTFLTGFIGLVISTLFLIILISLIDPGLVEILKDRTIAATQSMMESFGAPEDAISDSLDKIESDMEDAFTPGKQLLNILTSSIFALIIAAIVSIFVKKDGEVEESFKL